MSNKLDILCIDGTTGVGKTTQIVLFCNLLKSHNIKYKVFSFGEAEDTLDTKKELLKLKDYLENNPEGLALCDGSIAADISDDIAKNMLKEDIWDKHQENLQICESINNTYNIINILLTPSNVMLCYDRIKKRSDIYHHDKVEMETPEHLKRVSNSLRMFDNNMWTLNMKFHNIDIDGSESMTTLHTKIQNTVSQQYQIKKPS